MRMLITIALASLLVSNHAGAQQSAPTDSGFACFENLSAPEFPKTALQARVDGSVWTWTHVSAQGAIDKIDTQVVSAWSEGPKLLTAPVEKALRAAKIRSQCFGKTVSIVFRYQLHGEPMANPQVTSRKEEPHILWIESRPEAVPGKR